MAMNKYVSGVKYAHFTYIRNAHEWLHHFTKRKVWAHINSTIFYCKACIKSGWSFICVRGVNFASFYDFDIWFLNCSHGMVYFVFNFITTIIRYLPRRSNTTCYARDCVDSCPAIDMHAFLLWTIEYFLSWLKNAQISRNRIILCEGAIGIKAKISKQNLSPGL